MVPHMRQQYLQWLKETNQLGIAGQFSENDGNLQKSIEYYLEAGLPGKAAKVWFHFRWSSPERYRNKNSMVHPHLDILIISTI